MRIEIRVENLAPIKTMISLINIYNTVLVQKFEREVKPHLYTWY